MSIAPDAKSFVGQAGSLPSQSPSTPSPQISTPGDPGVALHMIPEPSAVQTYVPNAAHAPVPALQPVPLSGQSSSTEPSQSSSAPLQLSTVVPVASLHMIVPPEQKYVPS